MVIGAHVANPERFDLLDEVTVDAVAFERDREVAAVAAHVDEHESGNENTGHRRLPSPQRDDARPEKNRHDREQEQQIPWLICHPAEAALRKHDNDEHGKAEQHELG